VSIDRSTLTTLEQPDPHDSGQQRGYVYASATSLYMAVGPDLRAEQGAYASSSYSTYQATDSFVHKVST